MLLVRTRPQRPAAAASGASRFCRFGGGSETPLNIPGHPPRGGLGRLGDGDRDEPDPDRPPRHPRRRSDRRRGPLDGPSRLARHQRDRRCRTAGRGSPGRGTGSSSSGAARRPRFPSRRGSAQLVGLTADPDGAAAGDHGLERRHLGFRRRRGRSGCRRHARPLGRQRRRAGRRELPGGRLDPLHRLGHARVGAPLQGARARASSSGSARCRARSQASTSPATSSASPCSRATTTATPT